MSPFRTNKFSITNTDAGRGTSSTWIGQFQFVGICDVAIIRTEVESVFVLVTQRGGGCGEQFNHHSGRDQTNCDEHKIHHWSLASNRCTSAGRDKHSPSRHGSVHLEDWLLVIGTRQAAKLRQAMAERRQCGKRRRTSSSRSGPFGCRLRSSLEPHQPRGRGVRGLALTEKWEICGGPERIQGGWPAHGLRQELVRSRLRRRQVVSARRAGVVVRGLASVSGRRPARGHLTPNPV